MRENPPRSSRVSGVLQDEGGMDISNIQLEQRVFLAICSHCVTVAPAETGLTMLFSGLVAKAT
jgi:hypothetical protein